MRFQFADTRAILSRLEGGDRARREGRCFATEDWRAFPPLVQPIPQGVETLTEYLLRLVDVPGRHLVVLLQAGAAALGMFEHGAELHTKAMKRYVVRGSGRAQPTHLKTRGKSRYGSRLRLQNARKLLVGVNEKLAEWVDQEGAADHVFYSCPVRMWPELLATRPPPPFDPGGPLTKIPLDVPVPTTEVMRRTYRQLCSGRIEPRTPGADIEAGR